MLITSELVKFSSTIISAAAIGYLPEAVDDDGKLIEDVNTSRVCVIYAADGNMHVMTGEEVDSIESQLDQLLGENLKKFSFSADDQAKGCLYAVPSRFIACEYLRDDPDTHDAIYSCDGGHFINVGQHNDIQHGYIISGEGVAFGVDPSGAGAGKFLFDTISELGI